MDTMRERFYQVTSALLDARPAAGRGPGRHRAAELEPPGGGTRTGSSTWASASSC